MKVVQWDMGDDCEKINVHCYDTLMLDGVQR